MFPHIRFKTLWSVCNFINLSHDSPLPLAALSAGYWIFLNGRRAKDDGPCSSHFAPLCFTQRLKNQTVHLTDLSFWKCHVSTTSLRHLSLRNCEIDNISTMSICMNNHFFPLTPTFAEMQTPSDKTWWKNLHHYISSVYGTNQERCIFFFFFTCSMSHFSVLPLSSLDLVQRRVQQTPQTVYPLASRGSV